MKTEFQDEEIKDEELVKEELKSEDEAGDRVKAEELTEVKVEYEDDGDGCVAAGIEQDKEVRLGFKDKEQIHAKVKLEPKDKQKGQKLGKVPAGDTRCKKEVKQEPGIAAETKVQKEVWPLYSQSARCLDVLLFSKPRLVLHTWTTYDKQYVEVYIIFNYMLHLGLPGSAFFTVIERHLSGTSARNVCLL